MKDTTCGKLRAPCVNTGLLMICLLFLANCATQVGMPESTNFDLSSSYAVRSFEKSKNLLTSWTRGILARITII